MCSAQFMPLGNSCTWYNSCDAVAIHPCIKRNVNNLRFAPKRLFPEDKAFGNLCDLRSKAVDIVIKRR